MRRYSQAVKADVRRRMCPPQPTADSRSAATTASLRADASTTAPQPHRGASGRTFHHRGQCSQPPGTGAIKKSGSLAPALLRSSGFRFSAMRARHRVTCQHLRLAESFCAAVKPGPLSQNRAPHHRQPSAGPLCWRRLRPCPRLHRRRHTACLRRGACRRTAGLTRPAPTERPSALSRPFARNGPMRGLCRTPRNSKIASALRFDLQPF